MHTHTHNIQHTHTHKVCMHSREWVLNLDGWTDSEMDIHTSVHLCTYLPIYLTTERHLTANLLISKLSHFCKSRAGQAQASVKRDLTPVLLHVTGNDTRIIWILTLFSGKLTKQIKAKMDKLKQFCKSLNDNKNARQKDQYHAVKWMGRGIPSKEFLST